MTALGFALDEVNKRELHPGVELWEMKYKSFAYGKVTAYAIRITDDADAELKVMAADWNETHNTDNPAPKHTVAESTAGCWQIRATRSWQPPMPVSMI